MKNLFTLNKYLIRYKWHVLLGILFVSGANYFKVLVPRTIGTSLDYVIGKLETSLDHDALLRFSLIIVGYALLTGIFMFFMRQTIIVMSRLIEYDLRKDIFEHYTKLDSGFYKNNRTGDIMSRISEDVNKVRMYLGPALLYGINLVTLTIFIIYSMMSVSIKLSLYTLLPLPFLSVSIYFVSRIINRKSGIIQTQLAKLTSISQEVYSGIRIVKSYTQEKSFVNYFSTESENYKSKSLELARVNALFFPLMILLVSTSTLITIYVGAIEVNAGNISNGNIAEFVIYVQALTWPFMAIGWIASIVQEAEASQARINQFLDQEPEIQNPSNGLAKETEKLKGHIRFQNVSFRYADTGVLALDGVSFDLKSGQKMAIIGKTASGKSTIAELLLRMYDVTEGEIFIDGKNIKKYNTDHLRKNIGYVPQDVFLFSDTVENNIKYGKPEVDTSETRIYAGYAAVDKDILKLSDGYSTMVGERGVSLSGGQKQRISIARAFIKDPNLIILDDCLSAVDTNTEKKILDYIQSATKNRTAIIITHRIYALLDFDVIIVLDDGKIIEMGRHEELLEKKAFYASLFEKQQLEVD